MSVHPTAIVHKDARIASDVAIGPYAVIEADVELAAGVKVGAHAWMDHARIGEGTTVGPHTLIGGEPQMYKWKAVPSLVRIGRNNDIRELVTIHRSKDEGGESVVGDDCMIMANTHLGHDTIVGNNAIITTFTALGGHVTVGDHAVIGGQTAVHQFVRIGEYSMIGGCSRIIQDVVPYMVAEGNPAHMRNVNAIGLKRKGFDEKARTAIRAAFRVLFAHTGNMKLKREELAAMPDETGYIAKILSFIDSSKRGYVTGKAGAEE